MKGKRRKRNKIEWGLIGRSFYFMYLLDVRRKI